MSSAIRDHGWKGFHFGARKEGMQFAPEIDRWHSCQEQRSDVSFLHNALAFVSFSSTDDAGLLHGSYVTRDSASDGGPSAQWERISICSIRECATVAHRIPRFLAVAVSGEWADQGYSERAFVFEVLHDGCKEDHNISILLLPCRIPGQCTRRPESSNWCQCASYFRRNSSFQRMNKSML